MPMQKQPKQANTLHGDMTNATAMEIPAHNNQRPIRDCFPIIRLR